MPTALILIDIQNDYFVGGLMPCERKIEAVLNFYVCQVITYDYLNQ
jgi:nicotinamidase-related amidase